jgi:DNA-directed RNA polymerase specialized sigma24 family protein
MPVQWRGHLKTSRRRDVLTFEHHKAVAALRENICKRALRHGGGQQRVDMEGVLEVAAPCDDDELLAVNDALDKLTAAHAVQAEVVKLRYFVGMTNVEAAQALGLSERTVKNYWAHARAWLFREMQAQRR